MTWGRHPAIDFDERLQVGQEVEARFTSQDRALRFRARITRLDKETAHVESLEENMDGLNAGQVFLIPRFCSPGWSYAKSLYPWRGEHER